MLRGSKLVSGSGDFPCCQSPMGCQNSLKHSIEADLTQLITLLQGGPVAVALVPWLGPTLGAGTAQ